MSDNGDLRLDKESLVQITKGLKAAIGELKETGSGATDAVMGSGFEDLAMTTKEAGDNGLADDFEDFCDRWEWGVRALIYDANDLASRLGLAAGMIWAEDEYWSGTFKYAAHSLNPYENPGLSQAEVAKKGWDDILTPDAPDYSDESMRKAREDIDEMWAHPDGRTATMRPVAPPDEEPGEGPHQGGER